MDNNIKEKINFETKLDKVISIYLLCLCEHFNDKLYRIACILFKNIRNCLNKYGYFIIEEYKYNNNSDIQIIFKKKQQQSIKYKAIKLKRHS